MTQISRIAGADLDEILGKMPVQVIKTYLELVQSAWKQGTLDPTLKQMLSLRSAQLAECQDRTHFHVIDAPKSTLTEEQIAAVADPGRSSLSEKERLALQFAELIITTPKTMTDSFFEEMRLHFTDAQLMEITFFALSHNMMQRFCSAIDLRT